MSNALKKLLVVDDDPMIGKSIRRVLEKEYLVTTAADAKEALEKMQSEDLIWFIRISRCPA
jgi:CheY-like chemotaxis protein